MRTFKYTYVDAKGFKKEATVEADNKDDAYIILKTMRINPLTIVETASEDISLEILGQPDEKEVQRKIRMAGRPAGAGKKKGGMDLEQMLGLDELRRPPEVRKPIDWKRYVLNTSPAVLFALFAMGVAFVGWSAWATASETKELNWPQARATIVNSDMLVIGMFRKTYAPDISFTYSVNGETYETNSLFSHPIQTSRGGCISLMNRYFVGKRVYAFYNPDNPAQAFIEFTGETKSHFLSGVLGMLCFSLAVGLFFLRMFNEPDRKAKRNAQRAREKEAAQRKAAAAGDRIEIE